MGLLLDSIGDVEAASGDQQHQEDEDRHDDQDDLQRRATTFRGGWRGSVWRSCRDSYRRGAGAGVAAMAG